MARLAARTAEVDLQGRVPDGELPGQAGWRSLEHLPHIGGRPHDEMCRRGHESAGDAPQVEGVYVLHAGDTLQRAADGSRIDVRWRAFHQHTDGLFEKAPGRVDDQ